MVSRSNALLGFYADPALVPGATGELGGILATGLRPRGRALAGTVAGIAADQLERPG